MQAAAVRWQTVISPIGTWIITVLTRQSMKTLDYDPTIRPIFRMGQKPRPDMVREAALNS